MTKKKNAANDVDGLLAALAHPQQSTIDAVRRAILGAAPGITESIQWNAPSYATTEHFATFHLRGKSGIRVVLHLGAKKRALPAGGLVVADPAGLLEWRGADRAIVTFADDADFAAKRKAFVAIVRAWVKFGK